MQLYHEIKNKEPFRYVYWCFDCGRSDQGTELHHIRGRKKHEKYLSSTFNGIPLCKICHNKVNHSEEEQLKYNKINIQFLKEEHYKPVLLDLNYLTEYKLLNIIYEKTIRTSN